MEKNAVIVDGKQYLADRYMTILDFIDTYFPEQRYNYILAKKNNKLCELRTVIDDDCEIKFMTLNSVIGMNAYKRSLIFIMIKAFYDVFGKDCNVRVNVMSTIGKGLYCKILRNKEVVAITDDIIARAKARMNELIESDLEIKKVSLSTDDAIKRFEKMGMSDKKRLFLYRRVSKTNMYIIDDYEDYFYGYMAPSTKYISCFDLFRYDEGFILMTPSRDNPSILPKFVPQDKLFEVLNTSDEWGRMLDINNVGDLNESITNGSIRELMLVQEALQEKQIADIAQLIKKGDKKIVLIAGPSSSGKTTFSHRLSVQLRAHGLRPYPLALDNYFVDREFTPKDENGDYDFECIEAMDLKLFNSDMTRLIAGEEIEIPTFNFAIGKKEYKGKKMKLNDGDVLVAEGIHALNPLMTSKLPDESKFKVYISALTQLNIDDHNRIPTTDGRLIRRIVRDARTRGNDARDTIAMWQSVRRGEEKYIFPFQEQADAMFNSALIYELSVIKQYAEPLLFAVPRDCEEYDEAKRLLKFLDYFVGIDVTNIPSNSIIREFVGGGCFDL